MELFDEDEDEIIEQLERSAFLGDPDALRLLAEYRIEHGLCYKCGEQGILVCCGQIRCGQHAGEHLHPRIKNPDNRSDVQFPEEEIKKICMLCKKFLGGNPEGKWISHGYCEECGKKLLDELENKKPY